MTPEHSPDAGIARLWQELQRAPHDKHHDWRTPVLATQGLHHDGPQARTVVLRHADASLWSLSVYTDARSPKCAELLAQPLAQLTFWSRRLSWQLRVAAVATVNVEGEQVNAAWARMKSSPAAADYLGVLAPGQIKPANASVAPASLQPVREHHLAVLNFKIRSMDWLVLSREGHQRARITPTGTWDWLTA